MKCGEKRSCSSKIITGKEQGHKFNKSQTEENKDRQMWTMGRISYRQETDCLVTWCEQDNLQWRWVWISESTPLHLLTLGDSPVDTLCFQVTTIITQDLTRKAHFKMHSMLQLKKFKVIQSVNDTEAPTYRVKLQQHTLSSYVQCFHFNNLTVVEQQLKSKYDLIWGEHRKTDETAVRAKLRE